jgi:hypothetical protein
MEYEDSLQLNEFRKLHISRHSSSVGYAALESAEHCSSLLDEMDCNSDLKLPAVDYETLRYGNSQDRLARLSVIVNKAMFGGHSGISKSWQDVLVYLGAAGKDAAEIYLLMHKKGKYAKAKDEDVVKAITAICKKGIAIESPLSGKTYKFYVNPYVQGMPTKTLQDVVTVAKLLCGFAAADRFDLDRDALRDILYDIRNEFVATWSRNVIQKRGWALAGRGYVQRTDGDGKVTVPLRTFLDFFGVRFDRESSSWQLREPKERTDMARVQAEKTWEILQDCISEFIDQKGLVQSLNERLDQVQFGLVRHPIVGYAPMTGVKVSLREKMICVPAKYADRMHGINLDADGDIAFVIPVQ